MHIFKSAPMSYRQMHPRPAWVMQECDRVILLRATLVALVTIGLMSLRPTNRIRLSLTGEERNEECLIVEAELGGHVVFFQVDTGYAGPPVLSTSYLAVHGDQLFSDAGMTTQKRYQATLQALRHRVGDRERSNALDKFLKASHCRAFTSGCTMRLMGISTTVEQQADMMLCAPLAFRTPFGVMRALAKPSSQANAEVFVTNPLHGSCHILTCDFLLQAAPVLIRMTGGIELNLSAARIAIVARMSETIPLRLIGGAPVVSILIGDEKFVCTLDTGAPGPVTLGAQAIERLPGALCPRTPYVSYQGGINGDRVCSSVIVAPVSIGNALRFENLPIFVNEAPVEETDGYIGMGLLRAMDILLTTSTLGLRASGLAPRTIEDYRSAPGECVRTRCATTWQ